MLIGIFKAYPYQTLLSSLITLLQCERRFIFQIITEGISSYYCVDFLVPTIIIPDLKKMDGNLCCIFVIYEPANAIVRNALANAPKKPAIAHTDLQSPATAVAAYAMPVILCTMNIAAIKTTRTPIA